MIDRVRLSRYCGVCIAVMLILFPAAASAADPEKGRKEITRILDGIFGRDFRRPSRVRAALSECGLEEEADALAPTSAERARGAFDFAKEIDESESEDVQAYVASVTGADQAGDAVAALYDAALRSYLSGVFDGASGSLIWVDEEDKKKLCAYMLKEAQEFLRLRDDRR